MSLVEMLGMEDNPFGLFLILILLLGATGYFDPAERTEVQSTGEAENKPPAALPVWQTRPKDRPKIRAFSAKKTAPARSAGGSKKPDLLTAIFEMLGLPKPKKTFAMLKKALTGRQSRHPLLPLRHRMLQ